MALRFLPSLLLSALLLAPRPLWAQEAVDWPNAVLAWLERFNGAREASSLTVEGLTFDPALGPETRVAFERILLTGLGPAALAAGPGALTLRAGPGGTVRFGDLALTGPVTLGADAAAGAGDEGVGGGGAWNEGVGEAQLALERLAGAWEPGRGSLSSLELAGKDLLLRRGSGETRLQARSLELEHATEPAAHGRLDQTTRLSLEGLSGRAEGGEDFAVEGLLAELSLLEVDGDALAAWAERVAAARQDHDPDALPPLQSLWRQASLRVRFDRAESRDPDGGLAQRVEEMRIEAGLERGAERGLLSLSLLLAGSGLEAGGGQAPPRNVALTLLPERWRLPLAIEGVPDRPLRQLLLDLAAGATLQRGPVIDPEKRVDLDPFLGALRRAGTTLAVEGLLLEGAHSGLAGGGRLTLSPALPFGGFGALDLTLRGLDAAQEALRGSDDPTAARIAFFLTTLVKGLGKPEVGAEGGIVYRYSLELGRDGSATLNGLPLAGLLNR